MNAKLRHHLKTDVTGFDNVVTKIDDRKCIVCNTNRDKSSNRFLNIRYFLIDEINVNVLKVTKQNELI